ncbi:MULTISPECIES: hypothetical protein [unclassified Lentimonas]|uniref:hypothetical protein n=1 Tax=unclassified Lentimonas TaxID=2630993 RepID=UPI00132ADF4B|nr:MULTISPECIES: hypothetical protein [unclassified Lentimonas]CAA6691457.1 Unannotated [Lentimonas sp. CC10]CAA6693783.1 Unannotated [Lentimonas sp. CC19]CAA7070959.1 Unannotated [Lentimonas sp. CC11]
MGWGRTLLLGDVGNRLDIQDTEDEIRRLKGELRSAYRKDMSQDQKLDALVQENAELKLYVASMIRVLTARGVMSHEELNHMVGAIDAEDGRSDGRCDGPIA